MLFMKKGLLLMKKYPLYLSLFLLCFTIMSACQHPQPNIQKDEKPENQIIPGKKIIKTNTNVTQPNTIKDEKPENQIIPHMERTNKKLKKIPKRQTTIAWYSSDNLGDLPRVPVPEAPCWQYNPKTCTEFQSVDDILIPVCIELSYKKIISKKQKDNIIKQKIFTNYLIILRNEIKKDIETYLKKCKAKTIKRKIKFQDFASAYFVTEDEVIKDINNEFKLIKEHPPIPLNNFKRYEYYFLGSLAFDKHKLLKQKILDFIKAQPQLSDIANKKKEKENNGIKWW